MYQFQGGKDETVTPARFLPSWWTETDDEINTEQSREALMAKFAKAFGQVNFSGRG